jgi:uncharacterized RDD family membrane protein YckC
MDTSELEYAGFWIRVWASIIDSIILGVLLYPLLTAVYGKAYWSSTDFVQGPMDFLISWVLPAIAVVLFWIARQATPGKMAVGARIVEYGQQARHHPAGGPLPWLLCFADSAGPGHLLGGL